MIVKLLLIFSSPAYCAVFNSTDVFSPSGEDVSKTNFDNRNQNETSIEPGPFLVVTQGPVFLFSEKNYNDKICNNEPTCDMVKNAPEELQQLGARNCMCDEECRLYGDCCLDSPYYNETEQKNNYNSFYCSPQELMYMQTKCPDYYTLTNIKTKCESSTQPLLSDDVNLVIPVTNVEKKITYGNEYCAQCHGDWNYQSWNISYYCSEDLFVNTAITVDHDHNQNETHTNPQRDYLWETTEAAKHVKFDSFTKKFRSTFNNRNYTCLYAKHLPEKLRPYVRLCIPSISECSHSANLPQIQKCLSYTEIVYYNNEVYKNKDCATCNGKSGKFKGCKSPTISYAPPASIVFKGPDKDSGNHHCGSSLTDKFC